jgi:hypothetical protein
MGNFDKEIKTYKTSGKHVRKSALKDMKAVVAELLDQQALSKFQDHHTAIMQIASPVY